MHAPRKPGSDTRCIPRMCTPAHNSCVCRRWNGAAPHLTASIPTGVWRCCTCERQGTSAAAPAVAVYKRQCHSSQSTADTTAATTLTSPTSALPRVSALSVHLPAVNSEFKLKLSCSLSQVLKVDRDLFSSTTASYFQPATAMENLKDTAVSFRRSSGNGELPQGGMCVTSL